MVYVFVHGAADSGWAWHLVAGELRARGHEALTPDLPCEDPAAGLAEYADAVVAAIGDRSEVVVVGHSLGGLTAPLVCARVPARMLVFAAAMVPAPGETGGEWWANTGYAETAAERSAYGDDERAVYFHDVPGPLTDEALARTRGQAEAPLVEPWPLAALPDVPTRYLLFRGDRLFPAAWTRGMVQDRLGLVPDEIDGGHCAYLSNPAALAGRLAAYVA